MDAGKPNIEPVGRRQDRRSQAAFYVLTLLFGVLAIYYVGRGTLSLLIGDPFDLRRRWIDEQYFYRGQNPYDVLFAHDPMLRGMLPAPIGRNSNVDPAIGSMHAGGYPPWSFISGIPLTGLPWRVMPAAFAAYNLIAVCMIACWSWKQSRSGGRGAAAFMAVSAIATMPLMVTLAFGQYAILILGFLYGAAWAEDTKKSWLAGILLGFAATKPNISAPFFLCFLVTGRWRTLLWAGIYLLASTLVVWTVTKTNPFEMMRQMWLSGEVFADDTPNLVKALVRLHAPVHLAIEVVALAGMAVGGYLLFQIRKSTWVALYAVAAVVARVWAYHRPYDDLMLAPLLLALGMLCIRYPRNVAAILLFAAGGASLWLPLTFRVKWPGVALQHVVWEVAIKWPGVALQHVAWVVGAAVVYAQAARLRQPSEPKEGLASAGVPCGAGD